MGAPDNGGPAFPTTPNREPGFYTQHGMSLRDFFAAHALTAIADSALKGAQESGASPHVAIPNVARFAYAVADAMLAAREGGAE